MMLLASYGDTNAQLTGDVRVCYKGSLTRTMDWGPASSLYLQH